MAKQASSLRRYSFCIITLCLYSTLLVGNNKMLDGTEKKNDVFQQNRSTQIKRHWLQKRLVNCTFSSHFTCEMKLEQRKSMLSCLPCNHKSVCSWKLSKEGTCQLLWVWIQRSITHQEWWRTNPSRNTNTNPLTVIHFSSTKTQLHTHKLDTLDQLYTKHTTVTHSRILYVHRQGTNVQTGVRQKKQMFDST